MKRLVSENVRLLTLLSRRIVANNTGTFARYAVAFLVDGFLIAWVATTIAPLADYFMDPTFGRASTVTLKYIALFHAVHLAPTLELLLVLFVSANLIKAVSSIVLYHYQRKFAYLTVHDLTKDCLEAFMTSGLAFFLSFPIGTLQNTLQKESEKLADGVTAVFMILAVVAQVALLSYVAWVLSHTMVITCVSLVLVFLAVMRVLDRWVQRFAGFTTATANVVSQQLVEALIGAKLVLAYGRGKTMVQKYSDAYRRHMGVAVKSQVLTNAIPVLYQAFGFFSVSLALYIAIRRGENLPTLIAALWAMLKIVPMFSQLVTNITNTSNVIPSFVQYNTLRIAARNAAPSNGRRRLESFREGISYRDVSFTYPGRAPALNEIQFTIPKGSFTAFVGESGSGKTTTADLLLRLLAPDSGEVSVDGVPLADYELSSFLDRVGYVQQESFLFHDSVRSNLLWARPGASDEDLWEALHLANIDGFVRSLPLQLDTVVGDRGTALSGGQRQRIALARALVKKPDILILDEATSALDTESERLIMKSIDAVAPYTTIVVIAHRLSTIARANFVCVFSGGRVVEHGSYAQLKDKPGGRLRELIASHHAGLVA